MTITLNGITLHPDLRWQDEFDWYPVEQSVARTLTGAYIVSMGTRTNGRPITLSPEDSSSAWMHKSTVDSLRNLAVVPGQVMTLILRGVTYSVIFRHHESPALDAVPVVHYNDVQDPDWYQVTLKLMEI